MVKIQFKTLQQKQFSIEAEPTETVRRSLPSFALLQAPPCSSVVLPQVADLKKKIEADQGFPVDHQKIIFSGTHRPRRKLPSHPLTLTPLPVPDRQDPAG